MNTNLKSTLSEKFFGIGEFANGGVDFVWNKNPTTNWLGGDEPLPEFLNMMMVAVY